MYDLSLTPTGDLSFTTSNTKARQHMFEFNFHVASSDSLQFNFVIESNNKEIVDNNKKVNHHIELATLDDLDTIEDPIIGTKIYVKETDTVYRITDINEISYLDDETIKKVGYVQPVETSTNFDFNFYVFTPKHDKVSKILSKQDYIEQAIKLRLETESGTIRGNESMGADLFKLLHSNGQSSKIIIKINNQVKEALSDILPNCTVESYIINSDYFNYHNTIKIVIINNEEVYYYYI